VSLLLKDVQPVNLISLIPATGALALAGLPMVASAAAEVPDTVATVIVSANRVATPADQVAASVTVIDAATLQLRQTVAVADVLAQTPGVNVVRNGGPGQTTTVHIRGAETEQTVVVVDGIRVNDPASPGGGYDFSNLLVGDIDRIEVLRGPASTLWGADAIGGVISITTARPTAALSGSATAEAGSLDTRSVHASAAGAMDRLTWRIGGGYYQTSGVSAFDSRLGGHERDGSLNASGAGQLGVRLTDWASLDLRYAHVATKTAFDGYPPPLYAYADTGEYGLTRQTAASASLKLTGLDGTLVNRFTVQDMRLDRENDDPTQTPLRTFYARGTRRSAAWQGEWTLAPAAVAVFGLESERTTIRTASPASYDPNPLPLRAHAVLDSAFVSGRLGLATGLTLTAGVREDHHDRFGDHVTASTGIAWTPDRGITQFRASFGQGFKAPTLYQLYGDYGFTGLRPETADGVDAGASRRWFDGALEAGFSLFSRQVKNQIGFFDCFAAVTPVCAARPFGYYANLDQTRSQGAELTVAARPVPAVDLTASYTFTDAQNRSQGANDGKALSRRPRDTAFAEASWRVARGATLSAAVRWSGRSFDDLANGRVLKAYALADLRGEVALRPGISLYGRIENLFDQAYQTAYQYGSVGRAAYLGVRARY
jgi:vitamin B12 transporter